MKIFLCFLSVLFSFAASAFETYGSHVQSVTIDNVMYFCKFDGSHLGQGAVVFCTSSGIGWGAVSLEEGAEAFYQGITSGSTCYNRTDDYPFQDLGSSPCSQSVPIPFVNQYAPSAKAAPLDPRGVPIDGPANVANSVDFSSTKTALLWIGAGLVGLYVVWLAANIVLARLRPQKKNRDAFTQEDKRAERNQRWAEKIVEQEERREAAAEWREERRAEWRASRKGRGS